MRVNRCFAFVDLCGFTAFAEHHGDERAVVVLAQLRTVLREVSARRGVRVVKWMGDGAMLSSTMIDAVAALVVEIDARMAEALPSLPIRVGLDWGPVIMFEGDDYIGRPVNVAARLCDLAGARQLLATRAVAEGAPPWVELGEPLITSIRGFDLPVEAVPLGLYDADGTGVTDPVCGIAIPRRFALESAGAPEGVLFCSEACAGSWRS
jgi:class 3 adenylate cyclase